MKENMEQVKIQNINYQQKLVEWQNEMEKKNEEFGKIFESFFLRAFSRIQFSGVNTNTQIQTVLIVRFGRRPFLKLQAMTAYFNSVYQKI